MTTAKSTFVHATVLETNVLFQNKNFYPKQFCGSKKYLVQKSPRKKIWPKINFGPKKIFVQKIFSPKILWVQKNFGSKKIGPKKNSWCEKNDNKLWLS